MFFSRAFFVLFGLFFFVSSLKAHDHHQDHADHDIGEVVESYQKIVHAFKLGFEKAQAHSPVYELSARSAPHGIIVLHALEEIESKCNKCTHEHSLKKKMIEHLNRMYQRLSGIVGLVKDLPQIKQRVLDAAQHDPHAARFGESEWGSAAMILAGKRLQMHGVKQYQHFENEAVSVLYGHDRSIAVYILVSQAIWEAFETVVSNLILPGSNIHVACTIFNGALLATAIPMEHVIKSAGTCTTDTPLLNRWSRALRISFTQLYTRYFAPKKHSASVKVQNITEEARENLRVLGELDSPFNKDLQKFFSKESTYEDRLLIWEIHDRLLNKIYQAQLQMIKDTEHQEEVLAHKSLRHLYAAVGRIRYGIATYSASLRFLVDEDSHKLSEVDYEYFKRFWRILGYTIEAFDELSEGFLLETSTDLESAVASQREHIWELTEHLIASLKKARSVRLKLKPDECQHSMML